MNMDKLNKVIEKHHSILEIQYKRRKSKIEKIRKICESNLDQIIQLFNIVGYVNLKYDFEIRTDMESDEILSASLTFYFNKKVLKQIYNALNGIHNEDIDEERLIAVFNKKLIELNTDIEAIYFNGILEFNKHYELKLRINL